ncbi:MAG: tRNA (adenosine(37)-N6)-dimethylallyltransferase MiaA [Candidatus Cloacimonetes bacterium]|nr:tRNA (adenosine(37)-N6)-dimethylallyltransferase MiaA [Candidatus Cloacimonadota bacterium]
MIKIISIEGATGSGKSSLALKLAKELNTEIISADSRQVYKFLNIGTAKPEAHILSEIKHHLIDIITPEKKYSAGLFVKETEKIIKRLNSEGKIPIICGGSMLYIKSLLEGISEIPEIPSNIIIQTKQFMETHNLSECYELVKTIDSKFSSSISPSDKQRISRALEVWFAFSKPITAYWETQEQKNIYNPFKICIDRNRNELYETINNRMIAMINQGLLEEIKSVLDMGYKKEDYGLNSVGYKEFVDIIISKNFSKMRECIDMAAQHTRNYAKRQITWYRKENFDSILFDEDTNITTLIEKILKK